MDRCHIKRNQVKLCIFITLNCVLNKTVNCYIKDNKLRVNVIFKQFSPINTKEENCHKKKIPEKYINVK